MHLDQRRVEYFADGTTQERSTREWAASLTDSDGTTPALCDTVNGTSDRQAYLVAPRHYVEAAQKQWSEYRARLSPPRHREARFHDSVPNLPNTTHINTEVQANVNFLERMSAAEIWQQAPSAIRAEARATPAPTKEKRLPPPPREASRTSRNNQSNNGKGNNEGNEIPCSDKSENDQADSRGSASSSLATEDDNDSTDSTQELTRASQNTYQARFHEQAQMFKSQQKAIESLGKTSSDRLSLIERQLHRFEALDTKLSTVGSQLDQVSTNQQTLSENMRAIKKDNKAEKTKTNEFHDQSDKKIDALSQTVANAMTAILGMGAQFNLISEQVFKISTKLENPPKVNTNFASHGKQQQTANVMSNIREMDEDETAPQQEPGKPSDASISSSSTKNSASSENSGTSTYTHKSPVKKKRSRSRTGQSMNWSTANNTIAQQGQTHDEEGSDEGDNDMVQGRNLEATFQQHRAQSPMKSQQDPMENVEGETEEAKDNDNTSQQDNVEYGSEFEEEDEHNSENNENESQINEEYDSELDEGDNYEEENDSDEQDDEFMTPPSSPEQNQSEAHDDNAPLNPQYIENTGSAGATNH
jgi:hypothetical protein